MLEESITSSPQKLKASGSIRDVRLYRRSKRRRLEESLQEENTNDRKDCDRPVPTLDDMFYDEIDSLEHENQFNKTFVVNKPPLTYGRDFDNIFEDEWLLSVADRLIGSKPLRSFQDRMVTSTHVFHKCEDLSMDEARLAPSTPPKSKVTSTEESQFGITESELLNFCEQVEEKVARPDSFMGATTGFVDSIQTPQSKKSKSIVESILNDFCSSPMSPEVPALPVHSRPPETSVALEDDCLSNGSSSGLSTQEDRTQITNTIAPIDMNRSQKLYENLLNLKTFFDQTSPELNSTPNFRFKHKPIRTYANRRTSSFARANIVDDLELVDAALPQSLEDDDLNNSTSSSLSHYQNEMIPLPTSVHVNRSQKLCENLSKLSASLSQSSECLLDTTLINSPIETSPELYLTALADDDPLLDVQFFEIIPQISKILEEILTLRQKYPVSYSSHTRAIWNDFCGFSLDFLLSDDTGTHTKDPNCLLADADASLCFHQFNRDVDNKRTLPTKNCDIKLNCKIENQFQNKATKEEQLFGENDGWNDDFFCNFKTQDVLKFSKNCAKEDDSVDHSINSTSALIPKSVVGNSDENTSMCVGFRTASRKNIKISTKGQEQYAKILREFPELLQVSDSNTISEKQASTTTISFAMASKQFEAFNFADDQPCTSRAASSRRQVVMPNKAKLQADKIKILEALETGIVDSELATEMIGVKNKEERLTNTKLADIDFGNMQLSEWALEEDVKEVEKLSFVESDKNYFVGFQVATKKAKKATEVQSKSTDFLAPASSSLGVGMPTKAKLQADKMKILEALETNFKDSGLENEMVGVEKTKAKLAEMDFELSEWLPEEDVKRDEKPKESKSGDFLAEVSDWPQESPGSHEFVGFRTAAAKTIKVSAASTLKAAQILTDLPEISYKPTVKSDTKASTLGYVREAIGEADVLPDEDIQLSEWILSPELKTTEEETRGKRKLNDDHMNDTPIQASKLLCQSRSTNGLPNTNLGRFNSSGGVTDDWAMQSPVSTRVINRKNLLSLSKSKKSKMSRIEDKNVDFIATPMKQRYKLAGRHTTPDTPNLREFFDSVPNSSTPQRMRMVESKPPPLGIKNELNSIDKDFKQFNWDNCNDSIGPPQLKTPNQLTDSSCAKNVTLKPNPSPQERIERLSMYGNPPAISPIAVNSAKVCRISGLRRSRRANLSN